MDIKKTIILILIALPLFAQNKIVRQNDLDTLSFNRLVEPTESPSFLIGQDSDNGWDVVSKSAFIDSLALQINALENVSQVNTEAELSTALDTKQTIMVTGEIQLTGAMTFPDTVTLLFTAGGLIKGNVGTTYYVYSNIIAGQNQHIFGQEDYDADSLCFWTIHSQDIWVNWFGAQADGDTLNATTNYRAFRDAWNGSGRQAESKNGTRIRFTTGVFYMNAIKVGVDGWEDAAGAPNGGKFTDIIGSGFNKTIIKLAPAMDSTLFYADNNFGYVIRDLTFDGYKARNTTMSTPLIDLRYYAIHLQNVKIMNANDDGLHFLGGQANVISLTNFTATNNGGRGLDVDGVYNFSLSGVWNIEGNGDEAIRISNDTRTAGFSSITGTGYMENQDVGIVLEGATNVNFDANFYFPDGDTLIHIQYDETNSKASSSNYISLRSSGKIVVDSLCYGNYFTFDGNTIFIDRDGRNAVNQMDVFEIPFSGDFSGTDTINTYTNPAWAGVSGGWFTQAGSLEYNSVFNEALAHVGSTVDSVAHILLDSTQYIRITLPDNAHLDTVTMYYLQMLVRADESTYADLQVYDLTNSQSYNCYTYTYNVAESRYRVGIDKRLKYISLPVWLDGTQRRLRFEIRPKDDANLHIYYMAIATSRDRDMVHVNNGTVVGYGFDNAFIATASLPDAGDVKDGTRVFDITTETLKTAYNGSWY